MSSKLARSAGLIGVATMASRVLGVGREMVLAAFFGAGSGFEMDAFNVAFRVPNLLRDLFAEGAMTAAFVPTFTRTLTNQRAATRPGASATWSSTRWCSSRVCSSLLGILFAYPITHAIAPEFARDAGQARADDDAHAHHAAVPDDGGGRRSR